MHQDSHSKVKKKPCKVYNCKDNNKKNFLNTLGLNE